VDPGAAARVAHSIGDELPGGLGGVLEFYVGLTGALILLVAVTTSISGSRGSRTRSESTANCLGASGD